MRPGKWLSRAVGELTERTVQIAPSEWAEEFRRLPPSVTSRPGPYDYSVTPYLREIVDCLDVRCPVREIAIMKGAQTGGTVGVMENFLGYAMAHVKTAPMMLVTATQVLAAIRIDEYIMPMIEQSGLSSAIQSNSENKRKAGATAKKISWYGGGFLIPTGSNEAANLRSISVRFLLLDEVDSYPIRVGRDGDPVALAKRRTVAFEQLRKVVMISTPTTSEESRISREYDAGDRRVWQVPCLGCGEYDEIRWRYDDRKGVQKGGIIWAMNDSGRVVPGSVRYACRHCGHCHKNEHKRTMLPRGRWEPTAEPAHPSIRSYHISGLMSPPGFYSWESAVVDWLKAWNVETKQPRNRELLQEFYNNVLGTPFRTGGSRLTMGRVARHIRDYSSMRVPNELAETMCGGKIGFLTCAADIQKDFIAAAVYAWGPGRVGYLIARYRFDGDTADPFAAVGPWAELSKLIDTCYPDGDGRAYPIKITLIDSGYRTAEVYAFCGQFTVGVYPLKGDDRPNKGPAREFKRIQDASTSGVDGWAVNVNHYKSRLAAVLRGKPLAPTEPATVDSVSFPVDLPNDALRELTAEEFVEKVNSNGGRSWVWKRVSARNELWDLTVYCAAARDIVAYMLCREHLELDTVVWGEFWELAESIRFGWAEVPPVESFPDEAL